MAPDVTARASALSPGAAGDKKPSGKAHAETMQPRRSGADRPVPGPSLVTAGHGTATAGELAGLLRRRAWNSSSCAAARQPPVPALRPCGTRGVAAGGRDLLSLGARPGRLPPARGSIPERGVSSSVLPRLRGLYGYRVLRQALARVLGEVSRQVTAVMCAETLWWRCHRRLIADAATGIFGAGVRHLGYDGRLSPHRLTEGLRRDRRGGILYDAAQPPPSTQAPADAPSGGPPLS
jgi:hypothetical protein